MVGSDRAGTVARQIEYSMSKKATTALFRRARREKTPSFRRTALRYAGRIVYDVQLINVAVGEANLSGAQADQPNPSSDPPSDVFWTSRGISARRHPEQIGPYRILAILGQGGMGIVYLAEQDEPRRTVALKVIRPDVEPENLRLRFRREAEALLRLEHPGIAQVYDVGLYDSDDGPQPYLAIEHVEGLRLTEYCRQHKLSVRQRMGMLQQICIAVHHAHQRGIVHRDLKPGNILVDAKGHIKILDFGLALMTDSDVRVTTLRTDVGRLLGTIPYMSPEQVTGRTDAIDPRSDIYALGVIGYELLADRLPYDLTHRTIPEAVRVIHDVEPTRLSTVSHGLSGDVETIIATALEKDPNRRYQSGAELGADIQRFLADRPIRVKPTGTIGQLRKFARRNKAIVAGVVIAFLALSVGLATTAWQAVRATTQQQRAEREAETQRQISTFLHRMLSSVNPEAAQGRDVTIRTFLDSASAELSESFEDNPLVLASLHRTVGNTYRAIGVLDRAESHTRRSYEIRREELGPADRGTLESAANLALTLKVRGNLRESEQVAREAFEISNSVYGPESGRSLSLANILGTILHADSQRNESEALYRLALRGHIKIGGPDNPDALIPMGNLGAQLMELGPTHRKKFAEAGRLLERALALRRDLYGDDHPLTITSLCNLALWRMLNGDTTRGVRELEDVHDRAYRILGATHPSTLSYALALSRAALQVGDPATAERHAREAFDRGVEARGMLDRTSIECAGLLVNILIAAGSLEEATTLTQECYDAAVKLYGDGHTEVIRAGTLFVDLYEALGDHENEQLWRDRLRGTPLYEAAAEAEAQRRSQPGGIDYAPVPVTPHKPTDDQ